MEWPLENGVTHRELYRLLDRAAQGEEVVLVRDGRPVARLMPPLDPREAHPKPVDPVHAV